MTDAGTLTFYINTDQSAATWDLKDWNTYALVTFLPGSNSLAGAVTSASPDVGASPDTAD